MKRYFILLLFLNFLLGCSKDEETAVETALKEGLATGEWTAASTGGGFENFSSFKNFQYVFEVADANQILTFEVVSADIDVRYALFDPLGVRVETSSASRHEGGPYSAKAPGVYRIVVAADRRAIGKFSLKVGGTKDGITLVPFVTLRSETQNWGPLGSGGMKKTFKNHFYTFEVTEDNSGIDIELESADTEVGLFLYDPLGALVTSESTHRYEYILKQAKKGLYTVMVGSSSRGSVGTYRLNMFGKVQNLKAVLFSSETKKDAWKAGQIKNISHTYSLDITSNSNSPLDIELSSPDVNVTFDLQDASGDAIGGPSTLQKSQFFVSKDLPKGNYRIYVKPYGGPGTTTSGGNYTISVIGQFSNLKKM